MMDKEKIEKICEDIHTELFEKFKNDVVESFREIEKTHLAKDNSNTSEFLLELMIVAVNKTANFATYYTTDVVSALLSDEN